MKRLLIAALIAAGCLPLTLTSVQASCIAPPGLGSSDPLRAQIDAAQTVFVGTVVRTANHDRVARVRVESIWKGASMPTLVTVVGTPDESSSMTSVDRTFVTGQRYLFTPSSAASPFQDSNCSATQPYSSQLEALRPSSARAPQAGEAGPDPTGIDVPVWVWPLLIVAAGGAGFVAWRRFRPRI